MLARVHILPNSTTSSSILLSRPALPSIPARTILEIGPAPPLVCPLWVLAIISETISFSTVLIILSELFILRAAKSSLNTSEDSSLAASRSTLMCRPAVTATLSSHFIFISHNMSASLFCSRHESVFSAPEQSSSSHCPHSEISQWLCGYS